MLRSLVNGCKVPNPLGVNKILRYGNEESLMVSVERVKRK